jgi:hydroxymethylpyrimidine pyrophosphatase-like HAD family hydrolase
MSVVEETPRMIAIDMDGTLVHPGGTITPLNQAAIDRARDAGARIVIATGRRHHYAMEVLRKASLHTDDVVLSSNGTVARTVGGTLIFRNTMQLETARWLCDALGEFRNAFVLTFDFFGDHGEDLPGSLVLEELDVLHGSIFNWMDANARWIRRVGRIEESLPQGDVPFEEAALPIQAMLCGPIERMARAEAMLTAAHDGRLSLYRTEYAARDLCILDILPVGSSKGTGLQRLLQRDGLAASQLMAIGDNWNDMPMLELARWPTLMGNAPEALRTLAVERGWPITANHDEGGVAEAIGAHFPAPDPS